ncbi:MAG: thioredoxin domain-containing protein [Gammaproteobacteria bacterium]
MPNQLAAQTSPYLLQHAENPVEWHAWDAAALQRARDEDKPILLSIGYSACHWCHVMERESFEDEAIAARMNELFVCIKVDREERPDLDKIYQTAHQMLTQRPGGWPLTLALTPHGHAPFFAGTYFPPAPRLGMPGFADVLQQVAAHYRRHHLEMRGHHRAFADAMAQVNPRPAPAQLPAPAAALAHAARELSAQFDPEFGGFGGAPKFPHPTQLELLLRAHLQSGDAHSAHMLELTLRKMAAGGLFDQLGGGFYRYSVDRRWAIPHFEKMLYDNAQLLTLYAGALQHHGAGGAGGAAFYRQIAARTAGWVAGEMQQTHGGYASTLDADSEGVEGKYYVWDESDLRALLRADEYAAVESFYGMAGEPNFEGKWHLAIHPDMEGMAARMAGGGGGDGANVASGDGDSNSDSTTGNDSTPATIATIAAPGAPFAAALASAKAKLLAARAQRIRPALDDKILTAWNGLMIKGMARAAIALGRTDLAESATRALDFVRANLWRDGRLLVTTRGGRARLNAHLDDYAFLAEGIVELLQAVWRAQDLTFAVQICDAMRAHFEDRDAGGFFFTSHDHEPLLHRPKSGPDDAIPSGNGAAIRALCKLGHLLGNTAYLDSAEKALQLFAPALAKSPSIHASILMSMQARASTAQTIILRGPAAELPAWQSLCHRHHRPETAIFAIPATATVPPALAQRKAGRGMLAYVCTGFECAAPISSQAELAEILQRADTAKPATPA